MQYAGRADDVPMTHRYRSRVNSWRPDARTRAIVVVVLFVEIVGHVRCLVELRSLRRERRQPAARRARAAVAARPSTLADRRRRGDARLVRACISPSATPTGPSSSASSSVSIGRCSPAAARRRSRSLRSATAAMSWRRTVDPIGDGLDAVHLALVAGWMTVAAGVVGAGTGEAGRDRPWTSAGT